RGIDPRPRRDAAPAVARRRVVLHPHADPGNRAVRRLPGAGLDHRDRARPFRRHDDNVEASESRRTPALRPALPELSRLLRLEARRAPGGAGRPRPEGFPHGRDAVRDGRGCGAGADVGAGGGGGGGAAGTRWREPSATFAVTAPATTGLFAAGSSGSTGPRSRGVSGCPRRTSSSIGRDDLRPYARLTRG